MEAVRIEQTKADAHRFYEHLNRALKSGNLAELDEVIAPDAVDHNPVPGMKQGLEGIKAAFGEVRVAFPTWSSPWKTSSPRATRPRAG